MFLEPRNSMIQSFCILCVNIKSNDSVFRLSFCMCVPVITPVTTLWMPLWRLTNEKEHWYLSIWTWRSQFTWMQSQPTPNHPINTPVSTSWGMQHNSIISLESFLFHTLSSHKIHSLFTWTLMKLKVRPSLEKLVAETSGLNELLANGNSDKIKYLKMSLQVGEQMITDTNYLKWVHGSVANGIRDQLLEPSGWLCLSELVADGDRGEYEANYLKTTVCSMAPRHCTIFFVIITSTCSSKCRLGSWNTGKAWYDY